MTLSRMSPPWQADGVYTMLVVHEFFDVLPLYLIEVCCRELPQCWDSHSIFTEKSSRLERGLDHLYPQPGCPNYPEIFGWPTLPWLIIDAFLPCLRKETLTSVNIAWILFPLTTWSSIRKTEISLMSYPVLIVLDALKIQFFLNSDLVDSNLRHLMLFK